MNNAHELFTDASGCTTVESENVFIHVALKMLRTESALESAKYQPFY